MKLQHNIPLKKYNTFGIAVTAAHFVSVNSIEELIEALGRKEYADRLVIGGGSNLLLTRDVPALVIHINNKGKEVVREDAHTVQVRVAAGENWHEFVQWALQHQYGGVENLSLIPGKIGAAPIQNIGAYGVELKDVFVSCETVCMTTRQIEQFDKEACQFGYRNSIFKNQLKGTHVITHVTLQLTKKDHRLHTDYGNIRQYLQQIGIAHPTIQTVSEAVIAIRKSKLPDPEQIGNSGSFFKNPVISAAHFAKTLEKHPDTPSYTPPGQERKYVKVPAGWLIEQCGFKGKRTGDAGVYEKQALVLVNYGNATGQEILKLAYSIQAAVKEKFNILIEPEVNIV